MFESLPTLHNCFIFGNVTAEYMSESDTAFAEELHYLEREQNATATNVGQTLGKCLLRYCETLSDQCYTNIDGPISADQISFWTEDGGGVSFVGTVLVGKICSSIPARISSDVGGIGVSNPTIKV